MHALFVDVGNVQQLNERLGHHAGDAALQAVARALSVTFRKNDVLARIGGTQFLVLTRAPRRSPSAPRVTGRIREHLGAPGPRRFVGAPVEICCGWTTAPGRRAHLARGPGGPSDWAMLESREDRQAAFGCSRRADGCTPGRNAPPPGPTAP